MSDLFTLLFDLKRTLAVAGGPLILIIVIRKPVPVPANSLLSCIRATLPAVLAYCDELAVAVEGSSADHALFRASFQSGSARPARATAALLFDTLSAAFEHTRPRAPHDVLELQRHVLRHSLPPMDNANDPRRFIPFSHRSSAP